MRFGLIGPSYQSQALPADCQDTENFYIEVLESEGAKARMALYGRPGLALFATLPESPVRGSCKILPNGSTVERYFAIGGTKFCEVDSNGVVTVRGTIATDSRPAYIAAGALMLAIASGGKLYAYDLTTNVLTEVDTSGAGALQGAVSQVGYSDGYFVALLRDSQKFQISNTLTALIWNPLNIAQVSVFPDNIVGMSVDHREFWFMGVKQTVGYSDTGNPLFSYEVIPQSFAEQGTIAGDSLTKLDNSIFALGGDERGSGMAFRVDGYRFARVSNHAIEHVWNTYPTIADAIGWAFQLEGHTFWVLHFPTADKTWALDVATGYWYKWSSLVGGLSRAFIGRCHAYAFDKHLVGDWNSGKVYQMALPVQTNGAWSFCDDAGTAIRRVRRSPILSAEGTRIAHKCLRLEMETGLGPQPPLVDQDNAPRDPVINMRFSDDSGRNWSNEYSRGVGQAGRNVLVEWWRLGSARNRVYELSMSDAVPWRIIDGYLNPEDGPSKRIAQEALQRA